MPRIPRPRLPRRVLVGALVAGAVSGALLGVGLSLVNLVLVALAVATLVGAGIGVLTIMWGDPGDVPGEELLVELVPTFATAGSIGALLWASSFVASWLVLRTRVPRPGAVVAATFGITVVAMAVLGTITTAAFVPALTLLGGIDAVPTALGIAVTLGLAVAPLGALAAWWMTWLMRARMVAEPVALAT